MAETVIIGYIYPNEGMSVASSEQRFYLSFRVNVHKTTKIPVYLYKIGGYENFKVKFQSTSGWRVGYVLGQHMDAYTKDLGNSALTSYYGSGISYVTARRPLIKYKQDGSYLGLVKAGHQIGFNPDDSNMGQSHNDWLRATHYRDPNSGMGWLPISPGQSYGFVDTECDTSGYSRKWGIIHKKNV